MATLHSYSSPRRAVGTARREPGPSALLLAAGAVGIATIRRGSLPTAPEVVHLAIGAGALVLLASVAPETVTMIAFVVLVFAALNGAPAVLAVLDRAGHSLDTLGG